MSNTLVISARLDIRKFVDIVRWMQTQGMSTPSRSLVVNTLIENLHAELVEVGAIKPTTSYAGAKDELATLLNQPVIFNKANLNLAEAIGDESQREFGPLSPESIRAAAKKHLGQG